jgi:pyruvate/2-oxoglutarate dehydrogenase complex dihydrolipoamide dehydrogenase (E3) component/uncharacterized membrane protein YdjX (TVP38/TMEM64 family)
MTENYDVVVVGAGSGGLTSAVGLAKVGKKVLLIEREHLGGECTNSGCIPSKALLHHAKTYAAAIAISGNTDKSERYRTAAFHYVRGKINEILAEETPAHFANIGITVVMGEAVFTGKRSLKVGDTDYYFKHAIIATGSNPRLISVPGLDTNDILTNQNIFTLETIPERTLIIGGGPIGMEMGQALSYLGSKVTIADTGNRFAKLEDPAVAKILEQTFLDQGITLLLNATIQSCTNKTATFITNANDGTVTSALVTYDKVLIAVGRVPNLPTGLEIATIIYDSGGITVDSRYLTNNKRIYALGDVADKFKFTHQADDSARGVVTRIVSRGLVRIKPKAVPKVTYTQPEIAQVGLSWEAAVAEYGTQRLHRLEVPFSTNDRARTDDATSGVLVVIVRRLSGKIIGAHIAGPAAGEIIAIFTLAIDNKLSLWKLRRTIYAYPTYARIIQKAGDYFFAAQIASLKSDLVQTAKTVIPKLLLLGLWVIGLVALYQYQASTGNTLSQSSLALFAFITTTTLGPLLYIVAYTVRPLTFFPGTALTILSGVFFGWWWGIVYTIIAANLSATLAYVVGRYFGGNLKLETSFFGRYVEACRQSPFITILTVRLLFLPFDGVNYAAGIIKIPYLPYIIATIIGTLLGIATFVSIGASLSVEQFAKNGFSTDAINSKFLLMSAGIFLLSVIVSKLLKK